MFLIINARNLNTKRILLSLFYSLLAFRELHVCVISFYGFCSFEVLSLLILKYLFCSQIFLMEGICE